MHTRIGIKIMGFIIASIYLVSCASSGTLSGGPMDVEPPKLIIEKSTPTRVTHYQGGKIELEFDEFIVVSNPSEVSVSPPLNYKQDVNVRGKKLTFEFSEKEELKDDVTYVINFSGAIKDYTEGNEIDSLKYVFSTGSKIDELKLSGSITNDDPDFKLDNKLIMLYRTDYDSITVKEKPLYFVKTDEDGAFDFTNLKEGEYKIFALEDKNANYFNDLSTESVGFLDEPLILSDSSDINNIKLDMFYPETPMKLVSFDEKKYGQITIEFSQIADEVSIQLVNTDLDLYRDNNEEKVQLWYHDTITRVAFDILGDTLELKLPSIDTTYTHKKIDVQGITQQLAPHDSLRISFSSPIVSYTDTLIVLRDSADNVIEREVSIDGRVMVIEFLDTPGKYFLTIDSAGVENLYGQFIDSTSLNFNRLRGGDLLNLNLEIENLDSLSQYLISLKIKGDVIEKKTLGGISLDTLSFESLIPDTYEIEILEDSNQDGEWTVGDYWVRRKPEKIKIITLTLKSNENTEQTIDWRSGKIVNKKEESEDSEEGKEEFKGKGEEGKK